MEFNTNIGPLLNMKRGPMCCKILLLTILNRYI